MHRALFTFHKLAGELPKSEIKKLAPKPTHQEFLDSLFSDADEARWRDFRRNLRSKAFVNSVQGDDRADSKMKRYAEALNMHYNGKGPNFTVPGSGTKTYQVKYHPKQERWSCSCPDWGFKRSHQTDKAQQECKHVQMVKLELRSQGETVEKTAGRLLPLASVAGIGGRVVQKKRDDRQTANYRAYNEMRKQASLRGLVAKKLIGLSSM